MLRGEIEEKMIEASAQKCQDLWGICGGVVKLVQTPGKALWHNERTHLYIVSKPVCDESSSRLSHSTQPWRDSGSAAGL